MNTRAGLPMAAPLPTLAESSAPRVGAWRVYLVLAVSLAPVCVPSGPGQSGLLDVVNVIALIAFAFGTVLPGTPLRVPFALPVFLVAAGSLVATLNAESLSQAALTLAQDAYLFAWLVLLVNAVRDLSDLRAMRIAWVATACAVAGVALVQSLIAAGGSPLGLLGGRGFRAAATLYNPNMLADYLVLSLFVTLGLERTLRGWVRVAAGALLMLGLVTTKSNGGMVALLAGLVVWAVVRSLTRRTPWPRVAAVGLLVGGTVVFGAWLNGEWGVGREALAALKSHTFASRAEHSSESRLRIWDTLERSYANAPLGIGPGNSGAQTLAIGQRERPGSLQSKEAHSDYLAFAIERGPLGVAGLLLLTALAFGQVRRYWVHARRLRGHTRGASAWTAAMAAALTASATHSLVIEKLHFRHFWLLLAVVCASVLVAERAAQESRERRDARGAASRPDFRPGLERPAREFSPAPRWTRRVSA